MEKGLLMRAVGLFEAYGFSTISNHKIEEDMTTITVVFKDGMFVPYGEHDYETARSLSSGKTYRIKITNDRNGKLLNKYMKMIDVVWENLNDVQQGVYHGNVEYFRHGVEMAAGCIEPIYDLETNKIIKCRTSVSYDNMSEKEFQELFERVKTILVDTILRKCDDEEYKDMIRCF